jgi:hypothetical protein
MYSHWLQRLYTGSLYMQHTVYARRTPMPVSYKDMYNCSAYMHSIRLMNSCNKPSMIDPTSPAIHHLTSTVLGPC